MPWSMFNLAFLLQEMSKKMCPKPTPQSTRTLQYGINYNVAYVKQYTLPVLREGKEWYVEFYAFDPDKGKLRRKRIKVNRVHGTKKRREYARDLIARITLQLGRGWNPWIAKDCTSLHVMGDVLDTYESYIDKMFDVGYYRKLTYVGYKSYLKNLREYIEKIDPIYYLYQLDKTYLVKYLDHIFIDRDNCVQTRNNYLAWLAVFCGWCVQKNYMKERATAGIEFMSRRLIVKQRTTIPLAVVKQIGEWCRVHDPHFMLACYLLYDCFLRPVEQTRLKIGWISIKDSTLTIPAEASKNRKTQVITLPRHVLRYAIDLGIFSAASSDYIFSTKLKPGIVQIDTKIFRDHWRKVSRALGLRKEWQFYSLKDTGITEMLDSNITSLTVRDQARHSSLAITNIYAARRQKANSEVLDYRGSL